MCANLEGKKLGEKLLEVINGYLGEHDLMHREGSIVGLQAVDQTQFVITPMWTFIPKYPPANTHDLDVADKLLHGDKARVFGDAGYRGIEKRQAHEDRSVDWYIAERPGKRKEMNPESIEAKVEKLKSQIRAKVEHPFRYMKQVFGYNKVRYRSQGQEPQSLHGTSRANEPADYSKGFSQVGLLRPNSA